MKPPQVVALLVLLLTMSVYLGCDLCKDETVDRIKAPEGGLTAITQTRDCGATTAETMWVSLQPDSEEKDVSTDHIFVLKHIHRLHVSWKDKQTLVIDCRDCGPEEVWLQVTKLGPTRIQYE